MFTVTVMFDAQRITQLLDQPCMDLVEVAMFAGRPPNERRYLVNRIGAEVMEGRSVPRSYINRCAAV